MLSLPQFDINECVDEAEEGSFSETWLASASLIENDTSLIVMRRLLEAGANPNPVNSEGRSFLTEISSNACMLSNPIIKTLLRKQMQLLYEFGAKDEKDDDILQEFLSL